MGLSRTVSCVTMPNFVTVGLTVAAETDVFLFCFQNVRRRPTSIVVCVFAPHINNNNNNNLSCIAPVYQRLQRRTILFFITVQNLVGIRDGRIVIFCQIPDSVNRRLISGRFRIRIRIFDVTFPTSLYLYKLQQIASVSLFSCNL